MASCNDRQAEYLEDILSLPGRHLLSLINDILDLSKVKPATWSWTSAPFARGGARQRPDDGSRAREPTRHILSSTSTGEIGVIEADERKIKQVIFNLLSNAGKFTPDRGRVDVVARLR